MRIILRSVLTLILVLIAAFCCFGFLASAEGEVKAIANPFRWLYGATVLACLLAIVAVWKANLRLAMTLVLVLIGDFCCFCFVTSGVKPDGLLGPFRWLHGATIVACTVAIVAVWRVKALRR